jgi:hypothetical protein
MTDSPLDPYKDILGIDLPSQRLEQNLQSFRAILEEIQKLRALNLTEVHPSIIFEPTAAYRRGPGK